MEKRIDARMAALAEAIERRKMEQGAHVDALSRSLFEFGQELAALDEAGLSAEAEVLGITRDDVRAMARMYAR